MFQDSFESGALTSGWVVPSYSVDPSVVSGGYSGSRNMKIYLTKAQNLNNGLRCEIYRANVPGANLPPINRALVWGFAVFIPADWVDDYKKYSDGNTTWDIVNQLFSPEDRLTGRTDCTGRHPVFDLRIIPQSGGGSRWQVNSRWDTRAVTTTPGSVGKRTWDLGPVSKGIWTRWVVKHWGDAGARNGVLQVFRNGASVLYSTGYNMYNDVNGARLNFGCYKYFDSAVSPASRTLYFDAIKVSNSWANGYAEVAP